MEKRIVEVNGVKMEIDLREATKIENFKIGDRVKVLKKRYDSWRVYSGSIIGFDQFQKLPTIIVCYLENRDLEFVYINNQSEDIEICLASENDLPFEKEEIVYYFDKEISNREIEIQEFKKKKEYFLKNFQKHFEIEKKGVK